ncbi:MAG: glycosyltransferase [Candidatus Bathyarchaeota archaeon]|nr:MAG: glycosyltransferase [Candidatus Bathyarchaeota archaeon]
MNSEVTVLIPTLNEEANIAGVIRELGQMGCRNILIIDGNSRDRTVEVAKEFGVDVIFQNGRGKGDALRQAFNHDGLNGGAVVIMDADGSMNPKEIMLFIEALNSGADLVKGSRFLRYGYSEDMSVTRRVGNRFFVFLVNRFWSADYTDLCYGFAAFSNDAIKKLSPYLKSKNFEIETEVFIKAKKLGLNVVETPSIESRRRHGSSNLSAFKDGIRILKTIIDEFFDGPLTKLRSL